MEGAQEMNEQATTGWLSPGFQKKQAIVCSILGALTIFASTWYSIITGDHRHDLTDTQMYVMLGLMGGANIIYMIRRFSAGSPEYTPAALRAADPTIAASETILPPAGTK